VKMRLASIKRRKTSDSFSVRNRYKIMSMKQSTVSLTKDNNINPLKASIASRTMLMKCLTITISV